MLDKVKHLVKCAEDILRSPSQWNSVELRIAIDKVNEKLKEFSDTESPFDEINDISPGHGCC